MPKPEFVYVTYIDTTAEKLWDALTSSAFTRRYWFNTEVRSDWKVGSSLALAMDGRITHVGEVLEADRPRRLAYTFKHTLKEDFRNEPASKVVFTVEPHGNVVKLTLTHEGFVEGSKFFDGISKGWPDILSNLKSMLETGDPLAIPLSALGIEGMGSP